MVNLIVSAVLQVVLLSFVPFVWWLVAGRKENFFKWIGLKKPNLEVSLARLCIITMVVAGIYIAAMGFIMNSYLKDVESTTSQFAGGGIKALPSILIYAIIQTSLSEEIFFRGFLGKRLINKFGFAVGNSIQSLSFGLVHGVPFFMATGNALVLILVTLLPCLIGFYQGFMNEKMASGSIIPSWVMHALLNILSATTASL